MKKKRLAWLALLGAALLCCAPAWAGETEEAGDKTEEHKPWQGRLADGRIISEKDLAEILNLHQQWVDSGGKRGQWSYLLSRSDLSDVSLAGANLSGLDLSGANLSGGNLIGAKLCKATMVNANLTNAVMNRSDLTDANLIGAELGHANLDDACLRGADLRKSKIDRVSLNRADLRGALFEPDFQLPDHAGSEGSPLVGRWPIFSSIANSETLFLVAYQEQSHPITALRDQLKKCSYLPPSRQLTHALRHNNDSVGLDSHIAYYLIAWPTNWGLSPLRPIGYMFLLIIPFSAVYWLALHRPDREGIWMIWDPNSLRRPPNQPWRQLLKVKDGANPLYGLYFSLLSAFHIGWREFNVGNWISRMQPREYTLRATGWVRVASGLQSLISVYLLALAVLTYFGRPFE
ncbi:MAG: pentapeptide repeat-containing protein [Desulfarculus sp.]|nr:pentapeptide repeat-containing protein [Desulfarculus sp.]